jgi:glyoxylase-like metal-dependent hydrolase (beta-lactamase superfamily II)
MAGFSTVEDACAKLASPTHCPDFIAERIEFQQGIRVVPLRTPTLLPATHTNCYVVGNGELVAVDPGAHDDEEIDRIGSYLEGLAADGLKLKAVLLTHHHGDHVGSALALKKRLGAELWFHPITAEHLGIPADRLLDDGDVVELAGSPPMRFDVLLTPGHARGHLCLVHQSSRAALVGDMVAGVGTSLIDPPEGDMAEYLRQLRRLRDLPVGALYPAHGPTLPDGPAKLEEYLQHRAMREAKILDAIPGEGATLEQIVEKGYDDVAPFARPIAERSTVAILEKLLREGAVRQDGERYLTTAQGR